MGKKSGFLRNILFILLVWGSCVSWAQEKEQKEEECFKRRKPGIFRLYTGLSAPDEDSPTKFDRFNTAFFWNSWIGDINGTRTKFYAIGHDINLMFDVPFGKKSPVGIGIGAGYSHFNIRNNGAFSFIDDPSGSGQFSYLTTYTGPKRWINRTVFNFVDVPFELRFRTRRERGKFKFYPGFKASFMVEDYIKWRIKSDEYKEFNFPDLRRLHYGPTLRIGVDNIMLWAYYDMVTLFKNSNSNKLQLFGAGISIGWF